MQVPPAVLCLMRQRCGYNCLFGRRSRRIVQGRVGVRLRQAVKHQEAAFSRLMEWDVGSSSVPTKGHPSWKAFFRGPQLSR